jgi:hypothetical protein
MQAGDYHAGEVARRRRPVGDEGPAAARRAREEGWAEAAALLGMGALGTGRMDRESSVAHEALKELDDVVLWTPGHTEPGLVALAELVVLAHLDVDSRPSLEALVACLLVEA